MDDDKLTLEAIRMEAELLKGMDGLDALLADIGDSRIVLLGEASHGTEEYYTWRAELTKRLIREKGFCFLAVEGDWPSCYEVNRWIQPGEAAPNGESAREMLLRSFGRWPAWMWANGEIARLAEWLRDYNREAVEGERAGFFGLDVYSLWESMEVVLEHLEKKGDTPAYEAAQRAFACFQPYGRDEQAYAVSSGLYGEACEDEVVDLLARLRKEASEAAITEGGSAGESMAALNAEMNALVGVNAEHYYRTMMHGDAESWNIRDRHMVEALERLLAYFGPEAKAIVWEHNTHIGDARATDMEADGMVNVGQLLREQQEGVYAVGFSTYRGTVTAGRSWGAPHRIMEVPAAWKNSWDELLHRAGGGDKLLLLRDSASSLLEETRGQRAIGVVYRPESEWGNYVPTALAKRYDALIYLEETRALVPLKAVEPALV